jgi:predicted acetyltransferase
VRVTHQPPGQPPVDYHMSEFFITRKSRKLGIGRDAAILMFNRFAGEWEVTEYLRNPGAVQFWRRVIAAYTRGQYMERVQNGEVRQRFRTYNNPLQRPR